MQILRVRDLMTSDVVTVSPETDAGAAWELMSERGLRHLVVVDRDGDLVGVVSHRDLLRNALIEQSDLPRYLERELLHRTRVREVMTAPVETGEPEQALDEAARTLFENKLGCLPIVEGDRVVGILTESDFVRWHGYGARRARHAKPEAGGVGARLCRPDAWPLDE